MARGWQLASTIGAAQVQAGRCRQAGRQAASKPCSEPSPPGPMQPLQPAGPRCPPAYSLAGGQAEVCGVVVHGHHRPDAQLSMALRGFSAGPVPQVQETFQLGGVAAQQSRAGGKKLVSACRALAAQRAVRAGLGQCCCRMPHAQQKPGSGRELQKCCRH